MSPTALRYSARVAGRARQHREAGWTLTDTQRLLRKEFGVVPHLDTIKRWTNPDYAAQVAECVRERNRRVWADRWQFKLGGYSPSPEYQAAFVRRLRAEGEPVSGIVRVCRVVFGGRWTRGRVLRLLEDES